MDLTPSRISHYLKAAMTGIMAILPLIINAHNRPEYKALAQTLEQFTADKDAGIGIAVLIDGKDTVSINGDSHFPMLSVYKFPQALAVTDYCLKNNISFADSIHIDAEEIKENTWSPMRDKYTVTALTLPISELIQYSVEQSDNNACDILFRMIGGPEYVDEFLKAAGISNIAIVSTEEEMHRDTDLCHKNSSTPVGMAVLLDKFDMELRGKSKEYSDIASMMENCKTGTDRILAPLIDSGAKIGHKTGTGDVNPQGRIIGINDVAYVHLPNGRRYALAVFIADSPYDMATTSEIIAGISKIVFDTLKD